MCKRELVHFPRQVSLFQVPAYSQKPGWWASWYRACWSGVLPKGLFIQVWFKNRRAITPQLQIIVVTVVTLCLVPLLSTPSTPFPPSSVPLPAQCFHAFWPFPLKPGPEDVLRVERAEEVLPKACFLKHKSQRPSRTIMLVIVCLSQTFPPFLCLF